MTSTSSGTQIPSRRRHPAGYAAVMVAAMIDQSAATYGVDPALVRAIAWGERLVAGRARAPVRSGSCSSPDTASWLGLSVVGRTLDPTNTKDNIDGGAAYLPTLICRTNRDLAAASYQPRLGQLARPLRDTRRTSGR